jgi:hypothetical protein
LTSGAAKAFGAEGADRPHPLPFLADRTSDPESEARRHRSVRTEFPIGHYAPSENDVATLLLPRRVADHMFFVRILSRDLEAEAEIEALGGIAVQDLEHQRLDQDGRALQLSFDQL